MRVTSIDVYSDRLEEPLKFSLNQTDPSNKYQIRTILGLDAEELIPRFYGFGKQESEVPHGLVAEPYHKKFFEFSMKPREVVMRVILNANFLNNESYSDLRDELYRAISSTRTGKVTLQFNSGATAVAQLEGFINKFEAGYFNALPEVQMTVRCDDPLFRGVLPIIYDMTDARYPDPIMVDSFLQLPDSLGTAPHGFKFEGVYSGYSLSLGAFSLRDTPDAADSEWTFDVDYEFSPGDKLIFSSVNLHKTLYVEHGPPDEGLTVFLLDKITSVSTWPIMFPGSNEIYCNHHDHGIFAFTNVEYYPTYWGV